MDKKVRANCWSVTINNPGAADEDNIALARQRGWKVVGQLEQGEQGTKHYQLMLQTPQVRFSAIKKAFPRAHIEVSRNSAALSKYVQKEETRLASLSIDQSLFPSQVQLWAWYGVYYYQAKRIQPKATNLEIFDLMCGQKIRQGYYIGAECMNPQIRAYIKKFGECIAHREAQKIASLDRQTDRQANLISQEVTIPQYGLSSSSSSLQAEESDEGSSSSDEYASETE